MAVEYAMLLPILILAIFSSIEFGRAMMVMQILGNASRAGARAGTLPSSGYADVTAAVSTALTSAGINGASAPTVEVMPLGASTWIQASSSADAVQAANAGDAIRVTAFVPVSKVAWFTGFFLSGSTVLKSNTVMGKE